MKITIEVPETSTTKKVSSNYVRDKILKLLEAIYAVAPTCMTVSISKE